MTDRQDRPAASGPFLLDTMLGKLATYLRMCGYDAAYALTLPSRPVRCGVCNAGLQQVETTESTPVYAPDTGETAVWRCVDCGQHFWRGSHWEDVAETLAGVG